MNDGRLTAVQAGFSVCITATLATGLAPSSAQFARGAIAIDPS